MAAKEIVGNKWSLCIAPKLNKAPDEKKKKNDY